ncbi:MAG: imidazole glycerol phosphate synthase subunit HisH [Alphaproteobacteria bacterium]|nr:imidazole glycerol phosphate synthase subunit HisH [Alphaproteobacteria bacterium]
MKCVIVNHGSGNVRSVFRALEHVAEAHRVLFSNDPDIIANADHLVLPGVGAFSNCMHSLSARPGMLVAIQQQAREHQRPFLGICVGMQLLADYGEEYDGCSGLGWIPGRVKPFDLAKIQDCAIPHMGWSTIVPTRDHPLTHNLPQPAMVYFAHSFVFHAAKPANVWAQATYGKTFGAIVGAQNVVGTQFHPEKSQQVGLALLKNFLNWRP